MMRPNISPRNELNACGVGYPVAPEAARVDRPHVAAAAVGRILQLLQVA
jgi:hypothetical protein